MPNVDFAMTNNGWNGDFEIDSTGDVILMQDTQSAPLATQQRLYRLLMTNPRLFDGSGNPISPGDDKFAVDWGAGVRALTGQMVTPSFISTLQAHILNALASDPGVATDPAPVVSVVNVGGNVVQVNVTCTSVTGEIVTLPSFKLPGS